MEDNNNQGSQRQNHPADQNPNLGQTEHTYWENAGMAQGNSVPPQNMPDSLGTPNQYSQDPNQQNYQNPQNQNLQFTDASNYQDTQNQYSQNQYSQNQYSQNQNAQNWQNTQNTQDANNSSQFYQYYQQQMNNGNNYGQPQPGVGPVQPSMMPMNQKKKSHKGLVAAIIALVLVLAGGGTAYAFKDTLSNSFALMTKSPNEYYEYVEKKAIENQINEIKPYLNSVDTDVAAQVSMSVTYDRETVNSLLQSSMGESIEDIEANIGLPLNSLGLNGTVATKDGNLYESLGLKLNDTNIISMELLMDIVNKELSMRFPELSSAILKTSLDLDEVDSGKYTEQLKLLTPERTTDFLRRYSTIIAENMKDVELTKGESLKLDTLSADCNKLTVTIDSESAENIANAILEEAKDDEYIYDLLPMLDMSVSDFKSEIEDAQNNLKDSFGNNTIVEMDVYVDNKGEIIGRDITAKEDGSNLGVFGYTVLTDSGYNEYKFYYTDEDGNKVINATGSETKTGDTSNGALNLAIKDPSGSLPSDISVTAKYDDVKIVKKGNLNYTYGTYTISSPQAFGASLVIENKVENDEQLCKLSVMMGSSSLVTIDTKSKYLTDYDIPKMTGDQVYDMNTDMDSYISGIDFNTFIDNLSDKLGADLQWLKNALFGYSY